MEFNNKMDKLTVIVFLYALYPVFSLWERNYTHVSFSEVITAIIYVVGFFIIIQILAKSIIKDSGKVFLCMLAFILLFYNFGTIEQYLNSAGLIRRNSMIYSFLMLFLIAFPVILYIIFKINKVHIKVINGIGMSAIALTFYIFSSLVFKYYVYYSNNEKLITTPIKREHGTKNLRDIYYIVLDGRASSSTLKNLYNYDDKILTGYLESKNFFIANNSMANYLHTDFSLAASLNMKIIKDTHQLNKKDDIFFNRFQANVFKQAKKLGYLNVMICPGSLLNQRQLTKTDIHKTYCEVNHFFTEYHRLLFAKTPFSVIGEILINLRHYQSVQSRFEEIKNIATNSMGSKFVFAHILSPHHPMVFTREGALRSPFSMLRTKTSQERISNYVEQVEYIDKKVIEAIDAILNTSKQKPIIILQSDHGSLPRYRGIYFPEIDRDKPSHKLAMLERASILNAYLLPDDGDKNLYNSITPVNSFTHIFNHYYSLNLPFSEDRTYAAGYAGYHFEDITKRLQSWSQEFGWYTPTESINTP